MQVDFKFEGKSIRGYVGEPVAVALHAAGVRVLSRSFKFHRPRGIGLTCLTPLCPNCQVTINGMHGVAACEAPLSGGETVRRERAWPNADHDLLGVIDRLAVLLPAGFQFRHFSKRPRLAHLFEQVISLIAGGGRRPSQEAASGWLRPGFGHHRIDLLVIGGGPAGLAGALAAAEAGLQVALVEREDALGGSLRAETRIMTDSAGVSDAACKLVSKLSRQVHQHPRIKVWTGSTALGWYEGNVLPVMCANGIISFEPENLLISTGSYECPLPFPGSDLPGVMLAAAAQRLINLYYVRPGHVAAVVTNEEYGYIVADQLRDVGVHVTAIIDSRPEYEILADEVAKLAVQRGTRILSDCLPLSIRGRSGVRALRVSRGVGRRHSIPCDTVIVAAGRHPADELLLQRAYHGSTLLEIPENVAALGHDASIPIMPGVYLAGGITGSFQLADAMADGAAAANAILANKHGGGQ